MDNKINMDSWRILRQAQRREDDAIIDMLCATLATRDKDIAELETKLKQYEDEGNKDAAG